MKIVVIGIVVIVIIIFLGISKEDNGDSYHSISSKEVQKKIDNKEKFIILDVRNQDEYDLKHIENAILIPVAVIEEEAIKKLPNKDSTIIVYCRSGARSKRAAKQLVALGYTSVYDLGGIASYPEK